MKSTKYKPGQPRPLNLYQATKNYESLSPKHKVIFIIEQRFEEKDKFLDRLEELKKLCINNKEALRSFLSYPENRFHQNVDYNFVRNVVEKFPDLFENPSVLPKSINNLLKIGPLPLLDRIDYYKNINSIMDGSILSRKLAMESMANNEHGVTVAEQYSGNDRNAFLKKPS